MNGDTFIEPLEKALEEKDVSSHDYSGPSRRARDQGEYDGREKRGRRSGGFGKRAKWASGMLLGLASTATALATLQNYIPETQAHAQEAHAAINKRIDDEVGPLKAEVGTIKQGLSDVSVTVKKSQLTAARSRRREVEAEIAKAPPGSKVWNDYRSELEELNDDIEALRKELGR